MQPEKPRDGETPPSSPESPRDSADVVELLHHRGGLTFEQKLLFKRALQPVQPLPCLGDPKVRARLRQERDNLERFARSATEAKLRAVAQAFDDGRVEEARGQLELEFRKVELHDQSLQKYERACEDLARETAQSFRQQLGLSESADQWLLAAVKGPPLAPTVSSPSLVKMHGELCVEWRHVGMQLAQSMNVNGEEKATARSLWEKFQKRLEEYETACAQQGRTQFLLEFGFPEDTTEQEFSGFLQYVLGPLPDAATAKNVSEREGLKQWQNNLDEERVLLAQKLPIFFRYPSPASVRKLAVERLANLLLRRELYEIKYREKANEISRWSLLAGATLSEALEELAEESAKFSGGEAKELAEVLRGADPATRRAMVRGSIEAESALKRSIPPGESVKVPRPQEIIRSFGKPLPGELAALEGTRGQFWRDLFKIESPVTVALWMMYLQDSPDKIRATLNFATFIAGSKAFSAGIDSAVDFAVSRVAALRFLRLVKHPVVQFGLLMVIMFFGAEYVDKVSAWVSQKYRRVAGSASHNDVSVALGLAGAEPLFSGVDEWYSVHPTKDRDEYLRTMSLADWSKFRFQNIFSEDRPYDYYLVHDAQDWNAQVDRAVGNPLMKRVWQLEKIDDRWKAREAVRFSSEVGLRRENATTIETLLGEQLKKDGNAQIAASDVGRVIDIATSDSIRDFNNLGRNDRALEALIDNDSYDIRRWDKTKGEYVKSGASVSSPIAGIRRYIEGCGNTQLIELWNKYLIDVRSIATSTAVYRNLGMYASRDEWLGAEGERTELSQKGLVELMAYRLRRKHLLRDLGDMSRGDYGKYLGMSVKAQPDRRDAPFWFPNFLPAFTDKAGDEVWIKQIATIEPYILVRALKNAAEAAGKHLPKDHDINVLLTDLQYHVDQGTELAPHEVILLRDAITDALRVHHEGGKTVKVEQVDSRADLVLLTPEVHANVVHEGFRKDPTASMPFLLQEAFGKKLEQPGYLKVLQYIVPKNGAAIMTLTEFHCDSAHPEEWTVSTYRHHISHEVAKTYHLDHAADRGHTDLNIPFVQWSKQHPALLEKVRSRLEETRVQREKEFARLASEGKDQGELPSDRFVFVPGHNEYRRKYGNAIIIQKQKPETRTFVYDSTKIVVENGYPHEVLQDFGANPVEDTVYFVRREGQEDERIVLPAEGIDEYAHRPQAEQKMILSLVATPIDGEDEASIVAVLNVFKGSRRGDGRWMPSGFHNMLGYKPVYYYTKLKDDLLPLYTKATNKKFFLEHLFRELSERGGTINEENWSTLSQWFKNHIELFMSASAEDVKKFQIGDSLLGIPDSSGIYTKNLSSPDKASPLYYRFTPNGIGWQWSPDRAHWMPVSRTYVRGGEFDRKSPTTENCVFINTLWSLMQEIGKPVSRSSTADAR